ncbi:hypothetical protein JRO89_XS11G0022400 [Xanthoceras sorbifolium]|uniref:Short-chain dehydrogenase/reductase n=1 Tax=Xanthoceras sorbifolium TaxID=99658 RepID=A0ABQ8HEB5_9ROSI|nr:hypothetical protein JRO89_XS11G0022400 [Xanthoceras sorbifolium]
MADSSTFLSSKRYAVVTGGNKGVGFEICKQLASKGVTVVLTARNEKRGLEAVEKLKECGLCSHDLIVFHQLDVTDSASIASLANFIKIQFGKLDILVNNAGVMGAIVTDHDAYVRATKVDSGWPPAEVVNWTELLTETYEMAEECLNTNYYGAKRMVEALVSLLQLSDSPRIVNVSSVGGQLMNITSEWAKAVLSDVERLTEEKIDELLNKYLDDFKEGSLEKEGWPTLISVYVVSKVALNAYTRILAKKYSDFMINCVCPGYVKTDMNCNTGIYTAAEGAENHVRVALLPHGEPSGLFYIRNEIKPF